MNSTTFCGVGSVMIEQYVSYGTKASGFGTFRADESHAALVAHVLFWHMNRSVPYGTVCAPIARNVTIVYLWGMPTGPKSTPNAFNEALNTVIRMQMQRRSYNISDLAREADIPRPTLSRILSGHKDPELGHLQRIAVALNIPIAKMMDTASNLVAGKDPF